MKYDFEQIDNGNPRLPIYRLSVDEFSPAFHKYDSDDVRSVVSGLQDSLPFLFDDRLTVDAETLLGSVWMTEIGTAHNRTFGAILRRLVDLHLVPLIRLPKGSGTRVRFRINY